MVEKRIVVKMEYDTTSIVSGAAAGRAALSSFADVSKTSVAGLEREYKRLLSAINPAEKAQLDFARAVSITNELVKKGRLTQEQANATLREAEQHYRRQGQAVSGLGSIIETFGTKLIAAFAGYRLLQAGQQIITSSIREATEAAAAHALLETRVRATGGAAGYTAAQLEDMADAESRLLGIDDEVISGVEEMLLKYRNLTGEQFPRAVRLAIDMASEQGKLITSTEQVSGSVEKLGKLLNAPELAEKRLRREGKELDDQQKKLIATFLRQNDLAGAQKVLFAELERQYGGNALALRNEVGGALQAVEVDWNNLLEEFGKGLLFDLTGLTDLNSALQDPRTVEAARDLGRALGEIASAILSIGKLKNQILWLFDHSLGNVVLRGLRTPDLKYTPILNYTPLAGPPVAKQPTTPTTHDPNAERRAAAAQQQAEKLRATFADILKEHEAIAAKQKELLALYQKSNLTLFDREQGERDINDRYADRLTVAKALKQFEDLGAAKAREMAATILKIAQDERERARAIEAALVKLDAQVQRAKDYRDAVRETAKAWESMRLPDLENLLRQLGELSIQQAKDISAGSLAQLSDAERRNQEEFGAAFERNRQYWEDFSAEVRDGLTSSREHAQAEMDKIREAYRVAHEEGLAGGLSAVEMEQALATVRLNLLQTEIDAFGGAINFLAGAFGHAFSQLQNAYNAWQQGAQAGAQLGGAITNTSAGAAVGGVAGGIIGIWVAAYQWFTDKTAKDKAQSYGTLAAISSTGGDWNESFSNLEVAQRRASHQIQETIDEFARVLGGVFSSFADLEIQVRRDGQFFHAFVQGVLVGSFKDLQSATEAAILAAFRDPETVLAGVSDLVRQGFADAVAAGVRGLSLDELQDFLGQLREIAEISWTDATRQMAETVKHFDDLWDALLRVREASAAVAQGAADLAASETDAWRARIRTLTGEKESPEEQLARLRREGELTQAQLKMRIADLRLREIEVRQQLELLRTEVHLQGGRDDLRRHQIQDEVAYLKAAGKLAEEEVNLNQARIEALEAFLLALGALATELEDILADFDPGKIKLPRVGGVGGAADGGLGAMIEEARRQMAAAGQSQYVNSLADINRKWDEGIKAAGLHAGALDRARKARDAAIKAADGNKEAIDRANAAYERQARHIRQSQEEIDKANETRRAEIELLQRQQREATGKAQADYVRGPNVFAEERGKADDLKKQWRDLLDTGAVKWRDYKRAMDDVNRALGEHLRLLGLQESATLFGQLAGLLDQAGLSETAEHATFIAEQQKANFVLQLAEAQSRFAQLVAEGFLIGKNKELVETMLGKLSGLDPGKLFGGAASGGVKFRGYDAAPTGGDSAAKAIDDATKLREKYLDAENAFAKRLKDISADFDKIFASLGRGPENLELFRKAVDAAFGDLKKPVKDWLDSLGLSAQSPLTGQQQLDLAASQLDTIMARLRAGDNSAYQDLAGAGNKVLELAAGQYGTATEEYDRLYRRVRGLGEQALQLADASAANFLATGNLGPGNVEALPLGSQAVVDAIAAGNLSARQSASTLAELRQITESQAYAIQVMAGDIAALRSSNESLARELSAWRNARAS